MELFELCTLLDFSDELRKKVIDSDQHLDHHSLEESLDKLTRPSSWDAALENLKALLHPDEDGMKILVCQLRCACRTYDRYVSLGIPQTVFVATMKFFTRFLNDYKLKHGSHCFVWAWWAVRQISMTEFRIGELEYEMKLAEGKPTIDIHIPADTNLTQDRLRQSYLDATKFFRRFYPEYARAEMVCSSWLLSPSLQGLLPEHSRILQFQKSFRIGRSDVDSLGFMDWIFGDRNTPVENLPENTSLQRSVKGHLLGGGKIEWTTGTLIEEPFLAL